MTMAARHQSGEGMISAAQFKRHIVAYAPANMVLYIADAMIGQRAAFWVLRVDARRTLLIGRFGWLNCMTSLQFYSIPCITHFV